MGNVVFTIYWHRSDGMQGHSPSAGQLGRKEELCEAIRANEAVPGEIRALHPCWGGNTSSSVARCTCASCTD